MYTRACGEARSAATFCPVSLTACGTAICSLLGSLTEPFISASMYCASAAAWICMEAAEVKVLSRAAACSGTCQCSTAQLACTSTAADKLQARVQTSTVPHADSCAVTEVLCVSALATSLQAVISLHTWSRRACSSSTSSGSASGSLSELIRYRSRRAICCSTVPALARKWEQFRVGWVTQ